MKRRIAKIGILCFAILINALVIRFVSITDLYTEAPTIHFVVAGDHKDVYQVFYMTDGEDYSEERSVTLKYDDIGEEKDFSFLYDVEWDELRFDVGTNPGFTTVKTAYLTYFGKNISVDLLSGAEADAYYDISDFARLENGELSIKTIGKDPYFYIDLDKTRINSEIEKQTNQISLWFCIILCLLIDAFSLYAVKHFNALIEIPLSIWNNRKLVMSLARNDFRTKYAGSYLGVVWAFIQPIVTVLVYWFVFAVGFRSGDVAGYPFVLFLVVGIVPWFFFSDAVNGANNTFFDYNYLVKKVVFSIDILPFVKVLSALMVHALFVLIALILVIVTGYCNVLFLPQLLYYIICNLCIVSGLAYLNSAIIIFFKDLGQFINIFVLQIGVWITPIMWELETKLPEKLQIIFKLNPVYYIVDGFRDSLLRHRWFWEGDKFLWTIYFWGIIFLMNGFGIMIYRKLRPHFADML